MKYKDKFYLYTYHRSKHIYRAHLFRFRFDPVLGTGGHKKSLRSYMRKPKTTYEKKWSYAHKKYTRAKRRGHNLPEVYDDMWIVDNANRGWKRSIKKRQWMKKGNKNEVK